MYLNILRKILTENNEKYLFPCIMDLVANGLNLERFSNEDRIPSRQDITQYLAAWFKHTGLSSDECRKWMINYCAGKLSAISSSSKSRIRHSTKSNIKYIYKSDVIVNCRCEKNLFKAPCDPTCPLYEEMTHRAKENEAITILKPKKKVVHRVTDESVTDEIVPIYVSIKEKYREQFKKAMEVVHNQLQQRVHKNEIVNLLNNSGFKTRTGKEWSYSILMSELSKECE